MPITVQHGRADTLANVASLGGYAKARADHLARQQAQQQQQGEWDRRYNINRADAASDQAAERAQEIEDRTWETKKFESRENYKYTQDINLFKVKQEYAQELEAKNYDGLRRIVMRLNPKKIASKTIRQKLESIQKQLGESNNAVSPKILTQLANMGLKTYDEGARGDLSEEDERVFAAGNAAKALADKEAKVESAAVAKRQAAVKVAQAKARLKPLAEEAKRQEARFVEMEKMFWKSDDALTGAEADLEAAEAMADGEKASDESKGKREAIETARRSIATAKRRRSESDKHRKIADEALTGIRVTETEGADGEVVTTRTAIPGGGLRQQVADAEVAIAGISPDPPAAGTGSPGVSGAPAAPAATPPAAEPSLADPTGELQASDMADTPLDPSDSAGEIGEGEVVSSPPQAPQADPSDLAGEIGDGAPTPAPRVPQREFTSPMPGKLLTLKEGAGELGDTNKQIRGMFRVANGKDKGTVVVVYDDGKSRHWQPSLVESVEGAEDVISLNKAIDKAADIAMTKPLPAAIESTKHAGLRKALDSFRMAKTVAKVEKAIASLGPDATKALTYGEKAAIKELYEAALEYDKANPPKTDRPSKKNGSRKAEERKAIDKLRNPKPTKLEAYERKAKKDAKVKKDALDYYER